MALWGNEKVKKYTNVKLVATPGPVEKKDWPKFVILDWNYAETWESATKITGKLTWLKSSFTPKKGKMGDIFGFKAFIEDGEEVIVLESTITNASKDIANSLLNAKWLDVEISVYVNKNWYPSSIVRSWEEIVRGVIPFQEVTGAKLKEAIDSTFVSDENKPSSEEIDINNIPF